MKPGDIVRVPGLPGPHMVALFIEPKGAGLYEDTVVARWWDAQNAPHEQAWPAALLELVPVEGEAKEPVFDQNPMANALAHKAFEEKVRQKVIADMTAAEDAIRFAHTEGIVDG